MKGEGLTDKNWDKPLTTEELKNDPVLQRAVEVLSQWPPKGLALAPSS